MGRAKKTIEIEEPVHGAIPQEDEDGVVTEFVNISKQHQLVCIPNDPSSTIVVKCMAILKGEQWRSPYTEEANAWGRHPYFVERVKGIDNATEENPGGYDQTFVLTEKQVLAEFKSLGVNKNAKKRIRFLTDNAKFMWDANGREMVRPELKNPNQFVPMRERDDRPAVINAAADKIRAIEDMLEAQERALGSI